MKVLDLRKNENFKIFDIALLFLHNKNIELENSNWAGFSDLLEKATRLSGYQAKDEYQNLSTMLTEIKGLGESELNDDNAVAIYNGIIDKYRRDIVYFCDHIYDKFIRPDPELRSEYVKNSFFDFFD